MNDKRNDPVIGKTYDFDHGGSEPIRIKVNHVIRQTVPSYVADDGFEVVERERVAVSENGVGYYVWRHDGKFVEVV